MPTLHRRYFAVAALGAMACSIHERDLGEPPETIHSGTATAPRGSTSSRADGGQSTALNDATGTKAGAGATRGGPAAQDGSSAQGGTNQGGAIAEGGCGGACLSNVAGTAYGFAGAVQSGGGATLPSTTASPAAGATAATNSAQGGTTSQAGSAAGGATSAAGGGNANGGTSSTFQGCTIGLRQYASGESNDVNPCETCDPSKSTTEWSYRADGTSCGAEASKICHEHTCKTGCWIQGSFYLSGDSTVASGSCRSCQPQADARGWSNIPDGTRCGADLQQFCNLGQCSIGCWIDSSYRASGAADPDSKCRSCDPTKDNTGWSRGPSCVSSAAAGYDHTCVVLDSGALRCWGKNSSGQLGNGSTDSSWAPVAPSAPVSGSLAGVAAVASGQDHTCVVLNSGEVWCWGSNSKGQLGNVSAGSLEKSPVRAGAFTTARAVAAGKEHTCVVLKSGEVWCWGSNLDGQIGKSAASNTVESPLKVPDISANLVAAGASHNCAILDDESMRCWGDGSKGQLGDGLTQDRTVPVDPGLSKVATISAGASHTCAVLTGGGLRCWGDNTFGQLGIDGESPFENQFTPALVQLSGAARSVASGGGHTCVSLSNGKGQCFGNDSYLQLGNDANVSPQGLPVNVAKLAGAVQVTAGNNHNCAVLSNGSVCCWGYNGIGQLGVLGVYTSFEPITVGGLE